MPFGLVFGAVFFLVTAIWAASGPVRVLGTVGGFVVFEAGCIGVVVATGLVLRQTWARWGGAVLALFLAAAGALLVSARGDAMHFVVLLGSVATLVLLVVPPTGNPRRGLPSGARPWKRTGRVLGWLTLCVFVWFLAATVRAVHTLPAAAPESESKVASVLSPPAAARLEWLDFGPGLERAKSTGKPMLVDFYATWCGPCKMMDRETFRDTEVTRRLSEIVAVKVDSEGTRSRSGPVGADVAHRVNVTGYPTLVVLDPTGREVARRTGFVPPDEFAAWLDRSVEKAVARARVRA